MLQWDLAARKIKALWWWWRWWWGSSLSVQIFSWKTSEIQQRGTKILRTQSEPDDRINFQKIVRIANRPLHIALCQNEMQEGVTKDTHNSKICPSSRCIAGYSKLGSHFDFYATQHTPAKKANETGTKAATSGVIHLQVNVPRVKISLMMMVRHHFRNIEMCTISETQTTSVGTSSQNTFLTAGF